MNSAQVLAKAQAETRPCVIVGCDTRLPVRVSCVPRGDDLYAVVVDVDPVALVAHLPTHRRHTARRDSGSMSVAVVLAICIFGVLAFLALYGQGQRAMCALHHNHIRYCTDFTTETQR